MEKIILLITFLITLVSHAHAGTKEYIVGSGSEFKFTGEKGEKVDLSIYITESSFTKLGVEYFFSTGNILGVKAWQQYTMGITDKGLTLEEGYIQSPEMKNAEIMTKEFRENNDGGVKVEDFFFTQESDIEKYKIAIEKVEVPAGSISATHYRKNRDQQTIDFWVSDQAGAIGLVKLISKGKKDQNYKIELQSLIKNVKAKINPTTAIPLTDKGSVRFFLSEQLRQ